MTSAARFVSIASRDLIFVGPAGYEMPIHVAIGAPYAEAKAEEAKGEAGCLVLTCDDPDLTTEITGADEMEALLAGLEFLQSFLVNLESIGGKLKAVDGSPFDPNGSILLQEFRAIQARRNARQSCDALRGQTPDGRTEGMNREQAVDVKERALAAVEALASVLDIVKGKVPDDEFEQVKKGIGLAIGSIEIHVNARLYRQFPDLER